MFRFIRTATCLFSLTTALHAAAPDISNLKNCMNEVRSANAHPPAVQTFDPYTSNYRKLMADLNAAIPHLPHVYQEAAAKPLIDFLTKLGEDQFLQIFGSDPTDEQSATLQQILPDAALAVLLYDTQVSLGANAFEEVVSDLYNSFLSDENRVSKQGGTPIKPPTYGLIPPLVKFGNQDNGPYTWPADATSQILGMKCAVVSLPPSQLTGGLLAWSSLGHETGGHDVTHADRGLLNELSQKIHSAILTKFRSQALANYWAKCTDEISADALGYLNVGPSLGVSLIGYFRALGNGKLRTVGSTDDPHPIDLLRGYFAAAAVKRLHFKDALTWSSVIATETAKDNGPLYFVDENGRYSAFPVSFTVAVASADEVARVIYDSQLAALENHALAQIENWEDTDQAIVDNLVPIIRSSGTLPSDLHGPGFYASYVVAAATQGALEAGANIPAIFTNMQTELATMHRENPTWSTTPTAASTALLEQVNSDYESHDGKRVTRLDVPQDVPEDALQDEEKLAAV